MLHRDNGKLVWMQLRDHTTGTEGAPDLQIAVSKRDCAERGFNIAQLLVPELQQSQVEDQWAGLRPATPDGLPVLGETPLPNFSLATGHFRNGILLAPVTAQLSPSARRCRA